jgi:hypothetical protein
MPEKRGLYASAIRLIVQLVVLGILSWLLTELPMVKAISIPGLPFTITACVSLVIGVIMIIVLLAFRQDFVPRLRLRCPDLPFLGAAVSDALTLLVIAVAFTAFDGVIRPLMKQYSWAYALIFLVVALWPIVSIVSTLYHSAGPLADWICARISHIGAGSASATRCASCSKLIPQGAEFCTECGAPLTRPAVSAIKCAACGAANTSSGKYCMNCGASLEDEQFDTRVSI